MEKPHSNQNVALGIFKTHLDVGFTNYAKVVKEKYFHDFIINAVRTADQFRDSGTGLRYRWTVGSWLVYEFLQSATPQQARFLESAIHRGDICWHALPFTTHSEFAGNRLFSAGLDLAAALDKRFGKKTIAAKLTDVPGHTRGIIAPMVKHGIRFLHIGVNPATPVPDVPPLFRWVDSRGNSIVVMYQKDYGSPISYPQYGFHAQISVTGDNTGPHSCESALRLFQQLGEQYPDSAIQGGTLDDLANLILPHEADLPVVTGEIGDTWIHGVGTDPWKTTRFKALVNSEAFTGDCSEVFTRRLLEVSEHTWGMDEKKYFKNTPAFQGRSFARLRNSERGRLFAASWQEQRDLLTQAVDSLAGARRKIAEQALRSASPGRLGVFHEKGNPAELRKNPFFIFRFDPKTGALNHLVERETGKKLASPSHPLGLFQTESFSRLDYDHFQKSYLRTRADWALSDFGKPFLTRDIQAQKGGIARSEFQEQSASKFRFRLTPEQTYGSPECVILEYEFSATEPKIVLTLRAFHKEAVRIPHAWWFAFRPVPEAGESWRILKNGEWIDPTDVVSRGGRSLHGFESMIERKSTTGVLRIESPDVVLVSPGKPALLKFTDCPAKPESGIWFNLYNNKWGTNFPMWFDDDTMFHFELSFEGHVEKTTCYSSGH